MVGRIATRCPDGSTRLRRDRRVGQLRSVAASHCPSWASCAGVSCSNATSASATRSLGRRCGNASGPSESSPAATAGGSVAHGRPPAGPGSPPPAGTGTRVSPRGSRCWRGGYETEAESFQLVAASRAALVTERLLPFLVVPTG